MSDKPVVKSVLTFSCLDKHTKVNEDGTLTIHPIHLKNMCIQCRNKNRCLSHLYEKNDPILKEIKWNKDMKEEREKIRIFWMHFVKQQFMLSAFNSKILKTIPEKKDKIPVISTESMKADKKINNSYITLSKKAMRKYAENNHLTDDGVKTLIKENAKFSIMGNDIINILPHEITPINHEHITELEKKIDKIGKKNIPVMKIEEETDKKNIPVLEI